MRGLPPPVARFREIALRDGPAIIETVVIDTSATMHRPGMPRIPLQIRMSHCLGREFVHDIRIGTERFSFRFGLDAYVDGHGLMKVGPSVQSGIEFDQGALIALWGEALGFPSCWENREDVAWLPVDDDTARLVVRGPQGEIPIAVGFDPGSGCPAWCEADRHKSRGPKVGWRGAFSNWRRFEGGVLAPGSFHAKWADEPLPWLDVRTRSLQSNVSVVEALDMGRATLRRAGSPRQRRIRGVPVRGRRQRVSGRRRL